MRTVTEGAARIRVGSGVFYNPKMSKLRDISVLFVKALGLKDAKLLDATAATGVRGIRYALEAGVRDATLLDMNKGAALNARANVRLNKLKLKVIGESMQEFAGSYEHSFDFIDLDPFGSPVPLVQDALRVSGNGTALMVTATDTATLCGAEGKACLRIYGSQPIHNELCHEAATRILLHFIAREAAQFNFGIEPMLSIADMHYIRVFVRLHRGPGEAVKSVKSSGFGACCSACHSFSYKRGVSSTVSTKCAYCGKQMNVFGPLWLGSLDEKAILARMVEVGKGYPAESVRFVEKVMGEADAPFFYSIPKVTSYLKTGSVPLDPVLKRLHKKYAASRTHFEKDSIKTDAEIGEVVRAVKYSR
jgi:tRNA (guanine26-N2/guanine27-N2)-dimethyltransferase